MNRVEENQKFLDRVEKDYKEAIDKVANPNTVRLFTEDATYDVLVDISRSLAMIADDLHYYRQYESEVIERG